MKWRSRWFPILLVLAGIGLLPLGRAASAPPLRELLAVSVSPSASRFPTATAVATETPGLPPTLPPLPPTRTPRPSPTALPPMSATLLPVADSSVRGGAWANETFGTADTLDVKDGSDADYDRRTFLRFDLRGVAGAIHTATLRLFVTSRDGGPLTLASVAADDWSETALTWTTQPQAGPQLVTTTITGSGWVSFDVTAYVTAQLAGDKQVSLTLFDTTTARVLIRFSSREGAYPPMLELN